MILNFINELKINKYKINEIINNDIKLCVYKMGESEMTIIY